MLVNILAIFMGLIGMGVTMGQMAMGATALDNIKSRPEATGKTLMLTLLVMGFLESVLIYAIGIFLMVYLGS